MTEITRKKWLEVEKTLQKVPEHEIISCGWLKVANGYISHDIFLVQNKCEILVWYHPSQLHAYRPDLLDAISGGAQKIPAEKNQLELAF